MKQYLDEDNASFSFIVSTFLELEQFWSFVAKLTIGND